MGRLQCAHGKRDELFQRRNVVFARQARRAPIQLPELCET
jgi:hypothetical protein